MKTLSGNRSIATNAHKKHSQGSDGNLPSYQQDTKKDMGFFLRAMDLGEPQHKDLPWGSNTKAFRGSRLGT